MGHMERAQWLFSMATIPTPPPPEQLLLGLPAIIWLSYLKHFIYLFIVRAPDLQA